MCWSEEDVWNSLSSPEDQKASFAYLWLESGGNVDFFLGRQAGAGMQPARWEVQPPAFTHTRWWTHVFVCFLTGKTRTKEKYRVVYTDHQRLELEKEFHFNRYITIRRKSELAVNLGLSERQARLLLLHTTKGNNKAPVNTESYTWSWINSSKQTDLYSTIILGFFFFFINLLWPGAMWTKMQCKSSGLIGSYNKLCICCIRDAFEAFNFDVLAGKLYNKHYFSTKKLLK